MGEEEMGGNKRRREGTVQYFLMVAPRMDVYAVQRFQAFLIFMMCSTSLSASPSLSVFLYSTLSLPLSDPLYSSLSLIVLSPFIAVTCSMTLF